MSYSNTTPNLKLPQWTSNPSDRPSFLSDVNGAFSKIDESVQANKLATSTAQTTADNAHLTAENAVDASGENAIAITALGNTQTAQGQQLTDLAGKCANYQDVAVTAQAPFTLSIMECKANRFLNILSLNLYLYCLEGTTLRKGTVVANIPTGLLPLGTAIVTPATFLKTGGMFSGRLKITQTTIEFLEDVELTGITDITISSTLFANLIDT